MKKTWKRLISFLLVAALSIGTLPTQAFAAQQGEEYLSQMEIGDDILDHDVFYLATASASVEENSRLVYLLKVGRGGSADSESSVLIKIADVTAKYGQDYVVRVRHEGTKVEDPEDNFSLMEMIEGSDFEQNVISDSDEFADMLESDPEAQAAYQEGVKAATEFLEEASGLSRKYGDENPYAQAVEELYGDALGAEIDPVQQAANLFTGENATAQRLASKGDMFQDLQAVANVMTNVVVGASVELTFGQGETEKYLEIIPKDNHRGDGDRMFYVILGTPSGTTTNSAASSCAFTIVDDEEQEPAVVSFSSSEYTADGESVTVTVERSGAGNTVVSAAVRTTGEGTAKAGRDYSQVDTELVFPFGVDHLTVTIPVRTEYLTGAGSFGLTLEPTLGCQVGENATAMVRMEGTYTHKAGLYAAESAKLMSDAGEEGTLLATVDANNLSTYKTLSALNLRKPLITESRGGEFKGKNAYNESGFWQTKWAGDSDGGTVRVTYELTNDYWQSYFLAGAEVDWWRSYSCSRNKVATMQVSLAGKRPGLTEAGTHDYIYQEYYGYRKGAKYNEWYPYNSNRDFDRETRYIYPTYHATNPIESYSRYCYLFGPMWAADHPQAIDFLNQGKDGDCSQLWLWSIKPILRPFQVNLKTSEPLSYLKADGTRSTVTSATTTDATIVEAGAHTVLFQDDSFTVSTAAGSNVSQYGYLSAIKLMDGKDENKVLYTLATNGDPSNTSIKYTLSTDNMQKLISSICPDYKHGFTHAWYDLLRENPYAKKTEGYPTYVLFNVKPEFSYINSSVTLRNPYDFPVTMTISGTDYALAARETRKIQTPDRQSFHLGDTLAVTKIGIDAAVDQFYTPVGVRFFAVNSLTNQWNNGTMNFYDGKPVNFSGFDSDGRLRTKEIIVEPNLQAAANSIQVRIKTSELSRFDTAIQRDSSGKITKHPGVLAQEGTVAGEYTYFTYADEKSTVNGKLYAITATPLDGSVAEWYDSTTNRTYVGNTLYFTATDTPERNLITLSAAPVSGTVTLEGTLRYSSYNLRTGYSGNASNVPAVGAALAAGSAGGMANQKGYVTAGPVPISGSKDRYLRYMVSINGTDMVKELLLPVMEPPKNVASPSMLWDFNSDNAMNAHIADAGPVTYRGEKDSDGNDYYVFTPTDDFSLDHWLDIDNFESVGPNDFIWVAIRARNMHSHYSSIGNNIVLSAYDNNGYTNNAMTQLALEKTNEWRTYVYNLKELNLEQTRGLGNGNGLSGWTYTPAKFVLYPFHSGADMRESSTYIDYIAFFPDEKSARDFVNNKKPLNNHTLDISSNFPSGVSPVNSPIFGDIQITGSVSDSTYQVQDNTYIPIVPGQSADMTIKIKPAEYSYTMTGEGGAVMQGRKTEFPVSVQLVVYDANDVFKDVYDAVDSFKLRGGYMTAVSHLDFVESSEGVPKTDDKGNPVYDQKGEPVWIEEPVAGILPEPGDKLYLRLTTDRHLQAEELADGQEVSGDYRYSDIFTGMYFYQPAAYERPVPMGITTPIEIEYGNLPLIGSTGMDLAFPFVSVGIMKIRHGYRIYIGVSPVQIADTIKDTHVSEFAGAGGEYWKSLFSIKSPFLSFSQGLSSAASTIGMVRDAAKATAASNAATGAKDSVGGAGLGSHSWRFDVSVGVYFDFINPAVTQDGITHTSYVFSGMGGYVSITLGFTVAWYLVLPLVFLPAYFGIEIQGTVMGYLGADFNKDVEVTYEDALNGSVSINDGIDKLNGGIRAYGYVQLSLGVGLCGTLGVRISGKVNMIASWEPNDPNGSWGFYIGLSAGLIIDLFLFSIPLMYTFKGWPFGSFAYYANPEKWTSTPDTAKTASLFSLREGSGEDSAWLGDQAKLMGAFQPNRDKVEILAHNAYEHPDSQLITLSDGKTLALAFIDSDNSKGTAQRTTLKLSVYDSDTGLWSEPIPVAAKDTADFQPSMAETKDGKLLVAWMSPSDRSIGDLSTDDGAMAYLNSMEVYAAFVDLDGKAVKTKTDPVYGVTADTEVVQITNDHYTRTVNGVTTVSSYYDSNPTVVCDRESGDAMIYFIKSGRSALGDGKITDYINPYTNDCRVGYMIYNAEADTDTDSREVPAGWLFDHFYYTELGGNTEYEQMLIDNFGGQRFLAGASYVRKDGSTVSYAIPDFTAIGYNGLAVYAYTVDTDGSNDTDGDKELYLQVYDFRSHETKFRIQLTDDNVADAMPQFFRSRVNTEEGYSTDEANTHTKLFWYRGGKQVVYIDVTALLRDGILPDGSLIASGETECSYTDPIPVYFYASDSHASLQSADFKAVEDDRGNLYILWTDSVTDENGNAAQEIFGTGLVEYAVNDQEGTPFAATSGWSKPYQITRDGFQNDELAVAMSGENLIAVHNRYTKELVDVGEDVEYNGKVDFMPIQISDMALVADTLEPCGSVETENIALFREETEAEGGRRTPVTLPRGGEKVSVEVTVANNGMNVAQGYRLSLYAGEALIGDMEVEEELVPNAGRTHIFEYALPDNLEGLCFKSVAQEMRSAESKTYYEDTHVFLADPMEAKADYEITDIRTYQSMDGFHAAFTVANTGNAPSSGEDTLNVQLKGPANLAEQYTEPLYSGPVSLAVGESKEFDIPVAVTPDMIGNYGFVTALITVQKQVVEQTINGRDYMGTRFLSDLEYVDFDLAIPMNMELQNVVVGADQRADISFAMSLGDRFGSGSDSVTYAVDDLTIARIENGKVVGISGGETTLHATHAATGATVSAVVKVTDSSEPVESESDSEPDPEPGILVEVSSDEAGVTVGAAVSGSTAFVTALTDVQLAELTNRAGETGAVTIDLSSLPENITAVSIPAKTVRAMEKAMEDTGEGLTVRLPGSTVTFDPEALAAIAQQTTGDLKLNVEPITESKLNQKQQEAVAELDVQAVYDIYLTSNNTRITQFGGGKAAIEVAHKAKDGQQPGGFAVWYAADSGAKEKVPTTGGKDSVKFTVTHLSNYVVAYDETLPGACHRGETCPMSAFGDLDRASWYHDGVHWALEQRIMDGYSNGGFGPEDSTSRAMIVTMLHRLEGEPAVDYDMGFTDVEAGTWYAEAVRWAAANGIVSGYGDGRFGPEDDLTREQLAAILYRYAQRKGQGFTGMWSFPLTFADGSQVSDWAYEAMCWMTMKGILNGVGDNRLSPKGKAARSQVAVMLMRYEALR